MLRTARPLATAVLSVIAASCSLTPSGGSDEPPLFVDAFGTTVGFEVDGPMVRQLPIGRCSTDPVDPPLPEGACEVPAALDSGVVTYAPGCVYVDGAVVVWSVDFWEWDHDLERVTWRDQVFEEGDRIELPLGFVKYRPDSDSEVERDLWAVLSNISEFEDCRQRSEFPDFVFMSAQPMNLENGERLQFHRPGPSR